MARNLVLLGSTGSIGRQTLDVVREFRDRIGVYGLAAGSNVELLAEQVNEYGPVAACLERDPSGDDRFDRVELLRGEEGMAALASRPEVDLVVVATSGRAGLLPTLAALKAGKLVALANKETLVMAGGIIRELLRGGNGALVPIDSEHSAIWQCLQGEATRSVERLILTASGGALRHLPMEEVGAVTPEQALHHPTWSMGPKITIDSANLMNKGLEVIEAQWLFDLPMERIEVILHAESIVHSMVVFDDSSTKAQMGLPDMRLPIQYALSHPNRWPNQMNRLDLASIGTLHFGPVDLDRYPALRLALRAGWEGGTYPAVLSAADEVAVEAFLRRRISFGQIPLVVERTLDLHGSCSSPQLDDILEADRWARMTASAMVASP